MFSFQTCPSNTDFRETQCSSFNEKLFNGQKYTWTAYYHGVYFMNLKPYDLGFEKHHENICFIISHKIIITITICSLSIV